MKVRFVTPQDTEYPCLCSLRYHLFFEAHQLPFDIPLLHKGRELLTPISLLPTDPQPVFASKRAE